MGGVLVGQPLWFKLVVENTGTVPLENITLDDSEYDLEDCDIETELDPGETTECIVQGTSSATYGRGKWNEAEATGEFMDDAWTEPCVVSDKDRLTYDVLYLAFTPGFFKNERKHEAAWLMGDYTPDMLVGAWFKPDISGDCDGLGSKWSNLADDQLRAALRYGGGRGAYGGARILLRTGVAAMLNASLWDNEGTSWCSPHGYGKYPWSAEKVIEEVTAALESCNKSAMTQLASKLDEWNNGVHQWPLPECAPAP
jgi:hypothetical protein